MPVKLTTSLPIIVYSRPNDLKTSEWRELDFGPGLILLPDNEEIMIRVKNIDDDDLAVLIKEINDIDPITGLNLSENRKITDRGLVYLQPLKGLTYLNLSSCDLTNAGLDNLVPLTHLQELDLSFCNRINDQALRIIPKFTHLQVLGLQGCVKITHAGSAKIRRQGLTIKRGK